VLRQGIRLPPELLFRGRRRSRPAPVVTVDERARAVPVAGGPDHTCPTLDETGAAWCSIRSRSAATVLSAVQEAQRSSPTSPSQSQRSTAPTMVWWMTEASSVSRLIVTNRIQSSSFRRSLDDATLFVAATRSSFSTTCHRLQAALRAEISVGRPATLCLSLMDLMLTDEPTRYTAIAPEPTWGTTPDGSRIDFAVGDRMTRRSPLTVKWDAQRADHSGNAEQRHRRRMTSQSTEVSRGRRSHPPAAGVSAARRSRRVWRSGSPSTVGSAGAGSTPVVSSAGGISVA